MPMKKVCNHVIEVKKEFVPRKGKEYLLSRKERREVYEFIEKQLRKRYIRPSKSPQIALVFFVERKNGKKHMVQNYRYSNKWMIKNNYSLPLISDIVKNISTSHMSNPPILKICSHGGIVITTYLRQAYLP